MPTQLEITPIMPPTAAIPPRLGSVRVGLGLIFRSVRMATTVTNTIKNNCKFLAEIKRASTAPVTTPIISPGTMPRTISQRTACLRCCANALEKAVNTITRKEVPMAMCCVCGESKPCACSTHSVTGTITMPPPMPNSPARKPAAALTASTAAISCISHIRLVCFL